MPDYIPRRVNRGDPIRAVDFNAVCEEVARLGLVRGGAGLVVRKSRSGIQIVAQDRQNVVLGFTQTGGITARSGTAAGSGQVALVLFDGTNLITQTNTFTVYNLGTSAVAASQYVTLEKIYGVYWIAGGGASVNLVLTTAPGAGIASGASATMNINGVNVSVNNPYTHDDCPGLAVLWVAQTQDGNWHCLTWGCPN